MNRGVADLCLTTWLLRHTLYYIITFYKKCKLFINDSDGNRTRVTAVKGRCLNRLTTEPYFSFVGVTTDIYITTFFSLKQVLFLFFVIPVTIHQNCEKTHHRIANGSIPLTSPDFISRPLQIRACRERTDSPLSDYIISKKRKKTCLKLLWPCLKCCPDSIHRFYDPPIIFILGSINLCFFDIWIDCNPFPYARIHR